MKRSFLIVLVISSKVGLFLPSVSLKMEENIFSLWSTFKKCKRFVWFTVKYKTLRVVCETFVLKISHWMMLHGWVDQLKSWQQWNQNIKIIDITGRGSYSKDANQELKKKKSSVPGSVMLITFMRERKNKKGLLDHFLHVQSYT